jgi:hypothetical protein
LEDARHCSALSYRQVADRDYRVPEVIDRHSFNYYIQYYCSTVERNPIQNLNVHCTSSYVEYDVPVL